MICHRLIVEKAYHLSSDIQNNTFENKCNFSVIRINVIILYLKTVFLHDGDLKHAGNKLFLMILYTIADKKCLSYKQVDS